MSYRWLTTRLQHAFTQKVVACQLSGRIETNMQTRKSPWVRTRTMAYQNSS